MPPVTCFFQIGPILKDPTFYTELLRAIPEPNHLMVPELWVGGGGDTSSCMEGCKWGEVVS